MNKLGKRIISWFPALACMGLIFYLSGLPGDKIKLPDFAMSDKVVHFLAYAFLGSLITIRKAIYRQEGGQDGIDGLGQVLGILYGASDEFHQSFVPRRESSLLDWAADSLGILAGVWISRKLAVKFSESPVAGSSGPD